MIARREGQGDHRRREVVDQVRQPGPDDADAGRRCGAVPGDEAAQSVALDRVHHDEDAEREHEQARAGRAQGLGGRPLAERDEHDRGPCARDERHQPEVVRRDDESDERQGGRQGARERDPPVLDARRCLAHVERARELAPKAQPQDERDGDRGGERCRHHRAGKIDEIEPEPVGHDHVRRVRDGQRHRGRVRDRDAREQERFHLRAGATRCDQHHGSQRDRRRVEREQHRSDERHRADPDEQAPRRSARPLDSQPRALGEPARIVGRGREHEDAGEEGEHAQVRPEHVPGRQQGLAAHRDHRKRADRREQRLVQVAGTDQHARERGDQDERRERGHPAVFPYNCTDGGAPARCPDRRWRRVGGRGCRRPGRTRCGRRSRRGTAPSRRPHRDG